MTPERVATEAKRLAAQAGTLAAKIERLKGKADALAEDAAGEKFDVQSKIHASAASAYEAMNCLREARKAAEAMARKAAGRA